MCWLAGKFSEQVSSGYLKAVLSAGVFQEERKPIPPRRRMSGRYDGCFGRASFLSLFFLTLVLRWRGHATMIPIKRTQHSNKAVRRIISGRVSLISSNQR